MNATIKYQSLSFNDAKTYLFASLFVIGNILLPQLAHLMPQGGVTWLPIYFFTLIGAYCYGWRVGLLTAIASPVINCLLFSMPAPAVLPAIIIKSTLLAVIAAYVAKRSQKASLLSLTAVVLGYQILGTLAEWALCADFALACQDFRIGIPGMLLQIFGGRLILAKVANQS